MAKLTPMMMKKKKMEEALAAKKADDSKLLFEADEDDSGGSEEDHEVKLDNRSLFIRFQPDMTAEDIQELSPDICNVSLNLKNPGSGTIGFASEAAAEKNLKLLQAKANDTNGLVITYNGTKNGRFPFMGVKNVFALDRSKLNVSGLPENTSVSDLKTAFPKCSRAEVVANKGFIRFSSEEDCKEAFDTSLDLDINNQRVGVYYAFIAMPNTGNEKSGSFSPRGRGRGSFNGSDGFRGGRGQGFRGGRGRDGFRGGRGRGGDSFRGGRGRGGGEGFRGGRGRGGFRGGRGRE
uniref:RRM domain-containing protein n=1 Tax=Strigamia maritima TaxID=126957 RepID=T1IK97_STRMM